jgi:hypothetical protein
MSGGQTQEMLHREKPQEQQKMPERKEEIEFAKGGEGGGPKGFFRSVSSFSSVVCRPDPENPGRQICKRVEQSDTFDPF